MRKALWILSTPLIAGGLAWAVHAADEQERLIAASRTGKVHYFSRSGNSGSDNSSTKSRANTDEEDRDPDTSTSDSTPARFVRNRGAQTPVGANRPKNVYQDLFGEGQTGIRRTAVRKPSATATSVTRAEPRPEPRPESRRPTKEPPVSEPAAEPDADLAADDLPPSDEILEMVRGTAGKADVHHADHKAAPGTRNSVKHVQHIDKKSAGRPDSSDDLDDELMDLGDDEEDLSDLPPTPKAARPPAPKTTPRPAAKAPPATPSRSTRPAAPSAAAAKARAIRKAEAIAPPRTETPVPHNPIQHAAAVSTAAADAAEVPLISLKWVKLSEVNVMQECKCGLIVKNTGKLAAKDVIVEAHFPETVRLMDAVPLPNDTKKHLTWVFDDLQGGEEKTIEITMVPRDRGELATSATVRFTGVATNVLTVEEPMLSIAIAGPRDVMVGEGLTQEITVSNPGTGVAQDIVVHAFIPEGLEHPRGKSVEMGIGSLGPGETRPVRLQLAAVAGGDAVLKVEARGAHLAQSAQAEIKVAAPKLKIEVAGPALRYVNRAAQYQITVGNDGVAATDNVRVLHLIPKGFEYIKSDRAGKFDAATGAVTWFVGRLEAGQTVQLACELNARRSGDYKHLVQASGESGTRAAAELDTRVDSASAVVMEVTDLDDPVEVESQTAYVIKIRNTGSKAAQNLRLACELPQGVELIDTEGPTAAGLDKGTLNFRPLNELAAGGNVTYRVKVSGKTAGNLRLRAMLLTNASNEPLIVEELTKFYAD